VPPLYLGARSSMRSCQYCTRTIVAYRLITSIHNVGGECVTAFDSPRPAGIISVYRHHPVAVCHHHYDNLPKHVRGYISPNCQSHSGSGSNTTGARPSVVSATELEDGDYL